MTSMTRGALPASVYWRRRIFVLGTVAALVMVLVGLVRGGEPAAPQDTATLRSAAPEGGAGAPDSFTLPDSVGGVDSSSTGDETGRKDRKRKKGGAQAPTSQVPTSPPLATPSGQCADTDVLVSPVVAGAVAGRDVSISLALRTVSTAACTWRVSANHLALKITDGGDEVWASRECPKLVPTRSVVVRQAVTSSISLTWNSRRSEEGCPAQTGYAAAGDYTVAAAAIGGDPGESTFELSPPSPTVVTVPETSSEQSGKQSGKQGKPLRDGTGAAVAPGFDTR